MLISPTTLLAFSVCVGRALSGYVADQLGPINTYILIYSLSGVVQLALWLTAKSFAQVCVFAVMYGLVSSALARLI
jgi:predicted MFS family arabinose efflux permease